MARANKNARVAWMLLCTVQVYRTVTAYALSVGRSLQSDRQCIGVAIQAPFRTMPGERGVIREQGRPACPAPAVAEGL